MIIASAIKFIPHFSKYPAKPEARRCRQLIVDDDKYRELFSEDMWLEED